MNYLKYIAGAVILAAIVGGYFYPKVPALFGTSTQGGTFTTAKFFGIAANLAAPGANATSSSVLNSTGQDLYITAVKAGCEGMGQSNPAYTGGAGMLSNGLFMQIATTSTAAPATTTNPNWVGGYTTILATTTGQFAFASSTAAGYATSTLVNSGSTLVNNIWSAGSYITFFVNATNTAKCTFGVDAFSS